MLLWTCFISNACNDLHIYWKKRDCTPLFLHHLILYCREVLCFLGPQKIWEVNFINEGFSKSIFKNSYLWIRNENIQVKEKWKITWCWVHPMKLKFVKLAFSCWPTTPITLRHDWDRGKRHEVNNQKKKSSSMPCQVTSISKEAFHKLYCS